MSIISYKDKEIVIHDTAGQGRFQTLTTEYYKHAHGALVFYDVSDDENTVDRWIEQLKEKNENIPIVIVGNKIDLEHREHTFEHPCIRISCKTGENIDLVLQEIDPILKEVKILPVETWTVYLRQLSVCIVQ